jgi:adenosine deaminase
VFFGSGISDEYVRIAELFWLTDNEMAALVLMRVTASFAPPTVKDWILAEIDVWEEADA